MVRSTVAAAAFGAALLAVPAVVAPAAAKPGGCLKYGAAGAAAGYAAGHTVKGALAGCALGWFERRRHNRTMRERTNGRPGQSF